MEVLWLIVVAMGPVLLAALLAYALITRRRPDPQCGRPGSARPNDSIGRNRTAERRAADIEFAGCRRAPFAGGAGGPQTVPAQSSGKRPAA
jgi:hypothetical protein